MDVRLSELTSVKSFHPVHSLGRFGRDSVLGEFVATSEGAELIESILESLTCTRLPETEWRRQSSLSKEQVRRSHLIRANFGTGKTITMLALAEMLAALGDDDLFVQWRTEFHRFPTLQTQYDLLRERSEAKPYICLTLDTKEKGAVPFRDVVVQGLHNWLHRNRPDVMLTSEFSAAAEQLDSAAKRLPEALQDALDRHAPGLTIAELYQDLLCWDRSKLSLAYQIMAEAAGFSPSRHTVEMRSYYNDVRESLARDFGGIAVILDELHHFFTTSATFGTLPVSLADFDAFAVYVNDTKAEQAMPCVLVGAIHENLSSYLQGSANANDAFQQAVGRFNEYPLTSSISQAELIAGAFIQNRTAMRGLLKANPALDAQCQMVQRQSEARSDWLQCFPLHPSVVSYLPLLSRRLAQNDRTTFHFVDVKVRFWVEHESAVANNHLNLITLPHVFTYFQKAVEDRDPALVTAINNAVGYTGGGPLHRGIMEALACLHIASSVATGEGQFAVRNGVNRLQLADYLNFPDEAQLDQAIRDLTASGYVHLSDRNEYFLMVGGGLSHVELNRKVEALISGVDANAYLLERFRTDYTLKSRTVLGGNPSSKGCVSRSFNSHVLSPSELKAFTSPPGAGHSGNMLFVIPPLEWTPEQLEAEVRAELSRLHSIGAVVALPIQWDEIKGAAIRRQQALRKLKSSATAEQARTIDSQLTHEESQVNQQLLGFGQPGNWVFLTRFGELRSSKKELTDITKALAEKLYPKFPEFTANNLQTPTLIHSLLDRFLPNPVNLRCDNTTKGRVDSILAPVGLAANLPEDPSCYSLKAPSDSSAHPNSMAVWSILHATDLSSPTALASLYQTLAAPPFGLLTHMIELYLGVYIRVRGLALYNRRSGQYVQDLQVSVLKDVSNRKDDGFRLELPVVTDTPTLGALSAVWAPIARATGSQNWVTASDTKVNEATKRTGLATDVVGFCELVNARVLAPLRKLGTPDEAGEALVRSLRGSVSNVDLPPADTFSQVLAACAPDSVERLLGVVESVGTVLLELSEKWNALQQLEAPDETRYPDLAAAYAQVKSGWDALDLNEPQSASALLHLLESFQPLFLSEYSHEHDEFQAAREAFAEAVRTSPLLGLLRALGQINTPQNGPALPRASIIERQVLAERNRACRARGPESLLKAGTYACAKCPDGGYRLGTAADLTRDLRAREERLLDDLRRAVSEYLSWLEKLDTPEYAGELGLPGPLKMYLYSHDRAALGAFEALKLSMNAAMQDEVPTGATEDLAQLLPSLNRYLSHAAVRPTGTKRIRRTLSDVLSTVESLLGAQGLQVIVLDPDSEAAADRRREILQAVEQALKSDPDTVVEIVLGGKSVG